MIIPCYKHIVYLYISKHSDDNEKDSPSCLSNYRTYRNGAHTHINHQVHSLASHRLVERAGGRGGRGSGCHRKILHGVAVRTTTQPNPTNARTTPSTTTRKRRPRSNQYHQHHRRKEQSWGDLDSGRIPIFSFSHPWTMTPRNNDIGRNRNGGIMEMVIQWRQ